ncbi:arylamine N-acetyltransferase family protein [Actinophytocola sp.]|uniref:arylamine N-acetyltransferase family protein n=1 Tax=Actinophytocola sp. TaxID=1872138 RepID=UPI002D7F2194|nr:arylamine N-acetyltransferase [Actinophytocola sp.]HET9142733.1 arylamine N-acetyltransferase [Actinophytocola sp.]
MPAELDHDTVTAYLRRIGAAGPAGPTLAVLRDLHARHLRTVPFENLSIHLGEPITLDPAALADKIIRRRRGGFCYELNGLFGMLLAALGFRVTRLAARTIGADGTLGIPFDHLVLQVELDERWLVDVGFGRHSTHPVGRDRTGPQDDPDGTFLVQDAGAGEVDVLRDGEPQYRLEPRPRVLADFRAGCWWHQSSPESHFTHGPTCSMYTAGGRVTISGDRLIRTTGADRTETVLAGPAELRAAYRSEFGFELDRVPVLANRA